MGDSGKPEKGGLSSQGGEFQSFKYTAQSKKDENECTAWCFWEEADKDEDMKKCFVKRGGKGGDWTDRTKTDEEERKHLSRDLSLSPRLQINVGGNSGGKEKIWKVQKRKRSL